MKKREFLDLLKFYLKDMPQIVIDDILSDYEEHFNIAMENGKSEEDICSELGSPELIAKEYISGEKIHLVAKNAEFEQSDFEKGAEEENKKSKNYKFILTILAIIGVISILPAIFGFGMGVVGVIIAIILGILGILGIFFGIVGSIVGIIFTIFVFGITLIMSVINPIFARNIFPNHIITSIHPLTRLFSAVAVISFGLLVILLGLFIIKLIIKGIKNIFITIKWKKSPANKCQ
ncbi:MAG: DUF1700 domain-containing protein [Peptoanaerobacter stomatis]|uniref:DUF1700 domain-containing protein n=1 Tax=Peptoanaerobacter stomatis TaxID=796937 RepID=UPI003FA1310B